MSKSPEKLLREILNKDPENLSCFECGKTPVTFVNLISWSFCCQTCSGIIYQFGRVKSINSATFGPSELEMLQTIGGNKNAKLIWMHNTPKGAFPVKDMINWKYKDKKWYNPDIIEELKRIDRIVVGNSTLVDSFEAPTISRRSRRPTDDSSNSQVSELFNPSNATIKRPILSIQEVPAGPPRQQTPVTQSLNLNEMFNVNSGTINRRESTTLNPPAMPPRQQSPVAQQPINDFFGIGSTDTKPPTIPTRVQLSANPSTSLNNQNQFQDLFSEFSPGANPKPSSNFIATSSGIGSSISNTPKKQPVDDFFSFERSTTIASIQPVEALNPFAMKAAINEPLSHQAGIFQSYIAMVNSKSMENFLNDTFVKS